MKYFSLFLKRLKMTETGPDRLHESLEFRTGYLKWTATDYPSVAHFLYNRSDKVEIDGNRKQLFDRVHSGIDCEFVFYVRNHIALYRMGHNGASTGPELHRRPS